MKMNFVSAGHTVTEINDGKVTEHFAERKKTDEELREERVKNLPEFAHDRVSLVETLDRNYERAAQEAEDDRKAEHPDEQKYPGLQFVTEEEHIHYQSLDNQKAANMNKRRREELEAEMAFKKARQEAASAPAQIPEFSSGKGDQKIKKKKVGAFFNFTKKKSDKNGSPTASSKSPKASENSTAENSNSPNLVKNTSKNNEEKSQENEQSGFKEFSSKFWWFEPILKILVILISTSKFWKSLCNARSPILGQMFESFDFRILLKSQSYDKPPWRNFDFLSNFFEIENFGF